MVAQKRPMIKISKKADYAVLVMASLAHRQVEHDASGADPDLPIDPASAQDIADAAGLSRALVANILKALTRAELLESVRGAGGGYRLALKIEEINLSQIIAALEGPIRLVDCASIADIGSHDCSLSDHCPSRSAMRIVHDRIATLMEDIHLPELLQMENRKAILRS